MNNTELVNVNVRIENDFMVTDSRNIAEVFGKQHKHVLDSIRNLGKDVPNFRQMFFESTMPDKYGRQQKIFLMTRDGFTLLAMGFTGKEAIAWKLKYIEAFNTLEKAWNSPEQVMARALRIADQTISNLKIENKALLEDNERMKPKEIFTDAVTASETSILVRDLAKLIRQNGKEVGEKRLYKWMRDGGFILRNSTQPTQRAMEMGLFEIVERTIKRANSPIIVASTTKVTGKGQVYFINKFLEDNAA